MYNRLAIAGLLPSLFVASSTLAYTVRLLATVDFLSVLTSLGFVLFVVSTASASGFTFLYRLKKKEGYTDLIQPYENNQNSQVNHSSQGSRPHGSMSSVAGAVGASESLRVGAIVDISDNVEIINDGKSLLFKKVSPVRYLNETGTSEAPAESPVQRNPRKRRFFQDVA